MCCPYLCYIWKCNMAEPMLHTKHDTLYLVSALFYIWKCVMSISVLLFSEFGQRHIKMFQKVQERCSVSLVFKIWTSAKPLLMISGSWQSLCLAHVDINVHANFIKKLKKIQEIGPVSLFFRIWTSAKPRPIPNDIWQSLGLHLVNINVYAKFHHNIPLSSRPFSLFSEFGARQSLDRR